MIAIIKTSKQHVVFCYAGCGILSHQYIANQLQSQLNEYNRVLGISSAFYLDQRQYQADVIQDINTSESPRPVIPMMGPRLMLNKKYPQTAQIQEVLKNKSDLVQQHGLNYLLRTL